MEEFDTRDRIAQQCRQEALAVQDMLTSCAAPGSQLKRIVDRIRQACSPQNGLLVTEFPETPTPATTLFDPAAAGPPFAQWRESESKPSSQVIPFPVSSRHMAKG